MSSTLYRQMKKKLCLEFNIGEAKSVEPYITQLGWRVVITTSRPHLTLYTSRGQVEFKVESNYASLRDTNPEDELG